MLRVKNVFSDPPRSSDSDCNSINQPCAQDNWYTQTVGTLQNGGAFGPLKGNVTSCSDAPCKLSDANLGNPDSVCPTGYVFDKSALDKSKFCTLVSGAYSVGKPCPGCNPVCFLQLRNACRPQVPNLDGSDLAQCCSGSQLQCPAPQYPFCCPPTYCINNNTCGPFMSDWCIKTGFIPGRNSPCEPWSISGGLQGSTSARCWLRNRRDRPPDSKLGSSGPGVRPKSCLHKPCSTNGIQVRSEREVPFRCRKRACSSRPRLFRHRDVSWGAGSCGIPPYRIRKAGKAGAARRLPLRLPYQPIRLRPADGEARGRPCVVEG